MVIALMIGKWSPIHKDHLKSIQDMSNWAEENDANCWICSSMSKDTSKQPLSFEEKMKFVEKAVSRYENVEVIKDPFKGAWEAIERAVYVVWKYQDDQNKGVYIFTGSDHLEEYEQVIKNIKQRFTKKDRNIDFNIEIMPTSGRVDGIGISATDLRNAAKNEDYESFKRLSAFDNEEDVKEMYVAYKNALRESNEDLFKLGNEVISKLKNAFPNAEAYYIGGTARDWVSKKPCNDIDIACNLSKNEIISVFPEVISANRFGAGYIVIINYKGQKFDLDSVVDHDIKEKIGTGDLTFNCMAVDPTTGEVIDNEGGLDDLKSETLRFSKFVFETIKRGAEARSIFRPFKFQARWGWEFDKDTEDAIVEFCEQYNFNRVAVNNMRKILDAIKVGEYSNKAIKNMKRLGVWKLLQDYETKGKVGKISGESFKLEEFINHKILSFEEILRECKTIKSFEEILRESNALDIDGAWDKTMRCLNKIHEVGNKGYIVGGAVRDMLLGKKANDFDIMTDMSKGWISSKLGNITGSSWRNGDEVLFVDIDGELFDIKRIGRSRDFISELEMRDLTINAIAWDPITDEYIDPTNGREDLKNKVLAFTPKNEELIRNGQQPARVLRYIRFLATTGFTPSKSSLDALKSFAIKTKGDFGIKSKNNFENNWNKLKAGKNAEGAIKLMKKLGLYDYCINEFSELMQNDIK